MSVNSEVRSDPAIRIENVSKTYRGKIAALRGIAMEVRRGEIFGLLGPNGAGKSTLVKILMTVVIPDRCQGTLLGLPIGRKEALRRAGYLPENCRFPDYLSGEQFLDFHGALTGMPRRERRRRAAELLDIVGLSAWGRRKVQAYSKGMRQRLGVAQALINDPELVLLDEPTDGVDPVGRRDIRSILVRQRERGKTVFLNSHLLSELEMVCDRVAILDRGAVAAQGTLDELTRSSQRYEIEIAGGDGRTEEETIRDALAGKLQASDGGRLLLPGGEPVEVVKNLLRVPTAEAAAVQPLIDALRERGVVIRSVRQFRQSLEDLLVETVAGPAAGRPKPAPPPAPGRAR